MRSIGNRWIRGVGTVVLVGGLLVTSVVTADDDKGKNPFSQILAKLDQILNNLNGGGGGDGNHTLRWDQALPAAQRFVILTAFNSAAVLDKETGLVWERSPAITPQLWDSARSECTARTVGGRKGWRLPSVHELASLADPANFDSAGLRLPPGHPFLTVQSQRYWSATSDADNPTTHAWNVIFGDGPTNINNKTVGLHLAWCVRGGMNADAY